MCMSESPVHGPLSILSEHWEETTSVLKALESRAAASVFFWLYLSNLTALRQTDLKFSPVHGK